MFLRKLRREKSLDPILCIHSALEKINETKTLEGLLEASLKEALALVEAEVGSLFLLDEEKQELVLKGASGAYLRDVPDVRRRLDEGILGYVANRKTPLLVEDTRKDTRFQNGSRSRYRTTSFISVPILLHRRLIGVLNLTDKKSSQPFTKKDLEWITLFVVFVALHVEKQRLVSERGKDAGTLQRNQESRNRLESLEKEKTRLKTELEVSQKMASIGKLAAGIAHELNNPLDGTLRYIHLTLSHLKEGEVVREYLLEAKQGLERMANIVKNLLAFSGRQRVKAAMVDVNEVLENVLSELLGYTYPLRVEIIKAYHPDLPPLLDKGVDQLFTNIIKNAFEAMPRGGTLRIATSRDEQAIIVRIADTGFGITEGDKPFIFEPFFTTKDIDKGCGLGLAICQEIIQAYEGKIDVNTEKNRGSTFTIHFPLKYAVPKEASFSYAR
ncbi:MAG: ATP-binding protein [Candidatus Omnitrophota bacterium]